MAKVESAEDVLLNANLAFIEENYIDARANYDLSINLDSTNADAYIKRAQCLIELGKFRDAVDDANRAINLEGENVKAYLNKGIACYKNHDYSEAVGAFMKGARFDSRDSIFQAWILKAKQAQQHGGPPPTQAKPQQPKPTPQPKATPTPTPPPSYTPVPTPAPAPTDNPSKVRYEWYQSPTHVIVEIFVRGIKQEDAHIDIQEQSLGVNLKLSSANNYVLDLDLAGAVVVAESKFTVMSTKIEIKLKKVEGVKWPKLEADENAKLRPWDSNVDPNAPPANQSKKNWDKIVSEEPEDKDNSFNQLMRDMYSGATEDERRAMMKSFHESGGTVLSADWKDVGKGYVDAKPPPGVAKYDPKAL